MGGIIKSFAELIDTYLGIPYEITVLIAPFLLLSFLIWYYFIRR